MLILILYVDDFLLVGDEPAIESRINDTDKLFNVTTTREVMEYLGCRINTERRRNNSTSTTHLQTP